MPRNASAKAKATAPTKTKGSTKARTPGGKKAAKGKARRKAKATPRRTSSRSRNSRQPGGSTRAKRATPDSGLFDVVDNFATTGTEAFNLFPLSRSRSRDERIALTG